jgi:hypothetical protein
MTHLQQLIHETVAASVVNRLNREIDTTGEQLAREILADPDFRAELRGLIREAFKATLIALREPVPPGGGTR